MKRVGRVVVLTLSIIGLSLILGVATSRSVRAAVSALVTVSNTSANPVPNQSVEAKNAFQTRVYLTLSSNSHQITIPQGQRLVVEFVTSDCLVNSGQGTTQPVVQLQSDLFGGAGASYIFNLVPSPVQGQFYSAQPAKIYADSLFVAIGYSGTAPVSNSCGVAVSGHLVPVP